jgi:RHS repeat-associated protein
MKFTGHERDDLTGLDYMKARYSGWFQASFLIPDPANDVNPRNPQSWNRYAYVRNNPMNLVDPSGMNAEEGGKKLESHQSDYERSRTGGDGSRTGLDTNSRGLLTATVDLLGKTIQIVAYPSLGENAQKALDEVLAAVNQINENQSVLSSSEKDVIRSLNRIEIRDDKPPPGQETYRSEVAVESGDFTMQYEDQGGLGAANLSTVLAHDAYHVSMGAALNESNPDGVEIHAIMFQMSIGERVGASEGYLNHLRAFLLDNDAIRRRREEPRAP